MIIQYTLQAKELAKQLKNIGPKTAYELIAAGIDSPQKLKKMGAKKAYLHVLRKGGFCGLPHAAYLYALEGAIRGCHWCDLPEDIKTEYKTFTQQLREQR